MPVIQALSLLQCFLRLPLNACGFSPPARHSPVLPWAHHIWTLFSSSQKKLDLELDPQWPQQHHHTDQKMPVLWYGRLSLQLLPRCNWICFISLSAMTLKPDSCSKFRTHFGFSSCLAKKLCLNNWRPSQRKMSSHKFRDDVVFPVIEYVLNGISYQDQKKMKH